MSRKRRPSDSRFSLVAGPRKKDIRRPLACDTGFVNGVFPKNPTMSRNRGLVVAADFGNQRYNLAFQQLRTLSRALRVPRSLYLDQEHDRLTHYSRKGKGEGREKAHLRLLDLAEDGAKGLSRARCAVRPLGPRGSFVRRSKFAKRIENKERIFGAHGADLGIVRALLVLGNEEIGARLVVMRSDAPGCDGSPLSPRRPKSSTASMEDIVEENTGGESDMRPAQGAEDQQKNPQAKRP
ncbi:hypothetical protein B0H16DRAFT_1457466 [Mycena metata]|uniref:Uncharacterized protein n=1 Tax=Mycena metata TaxID=1033252 RepID=A0AAD7J9E9_9AGAR|nr:hypothetical protein B0H16DRAFT_1457466 [Mycena metata]